jgi:hypothetical protein
VLHLSQPRVERGAHDGGRMLGAQFEPRPEPGLITVWCLVAELDAEAPAIGNRTTSIGSAISGVLHGGHRPASGPALYLPAEGQILAGSSPGSPASVLGLWAGRPGSSRLSGRAAPASAADHQNA